MYIFSDTKWPIRRKSTYAMYHCLGWATFIKRLDISNRLLITPTDALHQPENIAERYLFKTYSIAITSPLKSIGCLKSVPIEIDKNITYHTCAQRVVIFHCYINQGQGCAGMQVLCRLAQLVHCTMLVPEVLGACLSRFRHVSFNPFRVNALTGFIMLSDSFHH